MAIKMVQSDGFEKLTIRSLASRLGVAPMSLYNHVHDKDDLLGEVVGRMLAPVWKPRAKELDWQAWIAEAADRLRNFLVSEPVALHVYLRQPVVSPAAIERMSAMLEVLRKARVNDESAARAYAAVHTYTIGFAALQASRGRRGRTALSDPTALQLTSYTTRQQFAVGLQYLLRGIEQTIDS
ncbi:MAG: TetR/AcrR family transcriptional regulator [Acidimicrobiales bacterium]